MPDKKVAVVTGAGRGIGRAIAVELAKRGCAVAVNYSRSEGPANEVVEEITAAGGEAFAVKADVSNAEEVKAMFKTVSEKLGPVNVLVCNAGVTRDNLLMRMKDADWDDVIKTDLSSLYYCAKEAVRPMLKGRWGRIVAIGFVKSLAREVASRGVTVNAIAPGFIETDMTAVLPEDVKSQFIASIPAGRAGTPQDVAGVAAFLVSDDAAYLQGQVIAVDGGVTMQ